MGEDIGDIILPAIAAYFAFTSGIGPADALWMEAGMEAAVVAAAGSYAVGQAMKPAEVAMPDYGPQFEQQQSQLTQEQSYGRRGTAELEQILLTGSEFEKNQAFGELRRRGEDENKLLEMSGRSTRSSEDQAALDKFVEENKPPTDTEMELMAAQIQGEREASLERDMEKERTRLKQISATRGTLDSSRNREMNLRLAEINAANKADLGRASRAEAVEFQKGIQDIGTQGFNRLLQGAGYAETQSRYSLETAEHERRYQEGLRRAKTDDQRSLEHQKFTAAMDRQLAVYNQESETARARAAQMIGLAEIPLKSVAGAYKQPTYQVASEKKKDAPLG